MNFDERNNAWMGSLRQFRQIHSRGSAPRVWSIQVVGNRILTWWGQLEGLMQHAEEILPGINLGKINEISPAAYALARAKKTCSNKHREGYREYSFGQPLDMVQERLIQFDALRTDLCFYKPDNSMGAGMIKKAEEGKVWYSRKRNGLAYIISRGTGEAKLYSRRMLRQHDDEKGSNLTWDDRFPHIIEAANAVIPENSILLGELVINRDGKDDFKAVQSITKSLTAQSLLDQKALGRPSFYIWDIAFWDGQDLVSKAPVSVRYELIHSLPKTKGVLLPIEYFYSGSGFKSPVDAITFAKQQDWEGFVVVDPEGVYGDKGFNFKGKPDRPGTVCAKLKPEFEDDFVALWDPSKKLGERSTKEKYDGGIKSVALFQYNSKQELVYICNCASGMTEEMKRDLAHPKWFPQVWQVAYTDRRYIHEGEDTNALDFPRFIRVRQDKPANECINPNLKKGPK